MRLYATLEEAITEIGRDLKKSPVMNVTRVQQRIGETLKAREAMLYSYSIFSEAIPDSATILSKIGEDFGFPAFQEKGIVDWLGGELYTRLYARSDRYDNSSKYVYPAESLHPALATTFEGNHPSYTYAERLSGMIHEMVRTLSKDKDSRRAFWPIFDRVDAMRSAEPTRIPCSLGYHFMIRTLGNNKEELYMIYSQRSSDYDMFWLTDVWLASRIQKHIAMILGIKAGRLLHSIHSLHSFNIDGQEIY